MSSTRWIRRAWFFSFACLAASVALGDEKLDPKGIDFFEKKIRPVLAESCYECHSAKSKSLKGGLLVDTREGLRTGGDSGAAVVPGNSKQSLLLEALRHEGLEMPPKGKLPDEVIANFERWVQMGAPDPRDGKAKVAVKTEINIEEGRKFWAFQPPKAAPPPKVKDAAWPKSDLDRFLLARLEAEGLKPVGDADSLILLRRVYFDLIGLPPLPEEIQAFQQAASRHPQSALETVVDRLLASPQFGERWGRHWLDVARYAESTGKERNIPYPFAWRYRDWVIDAFNADKPYDRFLQEQLAGDLLPVESEAQRDQQLIATGFLTLGPKSVNERSAQLYVMDIVDEQIDVVSRAILATTVACARCHDHKFDPIPTADYYSLAGIFTSTETYAGVKRGSRNWDQKELMKLASVKPSELPAAPSPQNAKLNNKQRKRLAAQLKSAQSELKDLEAQIAEAQKDKKDKAKLRKARQEVKAAQQRMAKIQAQLDGKGGDQPASNAAVAMAVAEAKSPADCRICIRGEVDDLGDEVPRGFAQVLLNGEQPKIEANQSGRLQLAHWLSSRDNPLTARVMVNRIWQHLFGVGIVETVDNFGELGERPMHPELLDNLAVEFMADGWSVKRAIRRIVLSRAYQLSSEHDARNYTADPENRLVWRMSRRRLDAEVIRDAMLAASGELDQQRPIGSPVMALGNGEIGRDIRTPDAGRDSTVRSVYLPLLRGVVPEMLSVFDVADPSLVVGQRDITTVATQALYLMNSPFAMERSLTMAGGLLETASEESLRVDLAYQQSLGRPASESERQRVLGFVTSYEDALEAEGSKPEEARLAAWSAVCQALFSSAEFRYVY